MSLLLFYYRLSLPCTWSGLRDAALSEKAGIPNCTFVHSSSFIGGHENYTGALSMARKSLRRNFGGLEAVFH